MDITIATSPLTRTMGSTTLSTPGLPASDAQRMGIAPRTRFPRCKLCREVPDDILDEIESLKFEEGASSFAISDALHDALVQRRIIDDEARLPTFRHLSIHWRHAPSPERDRTARTLIEMMNAIRDASPPRSARDRARAGG